MAWLKADLVSPNCGKLEINAHAREKVVLCHKFYAHLDVDRIEWAVYFTYRAMFCYAWEQNYVQHLPLQNPTPHHSNTPLQYSAP